MIKKIIKPLIFIAAFIGMSIFSKHKTDGFKIWKILTDLPYRQEWETPITSKSQQLFLKKILDQPFHYLGKGSQTYVFLSEDNNYVIKLIRFNHIRPSLWERLTSVKKCAELDAKLERDFTSYKVAYDTLKEETGLIFLHLNKTNFFHQKLTIIDKIGVCHTLDLDQTDFILQKRVEPFYPYLEKLMIENRESDAKVLISDLIFLLTKQYREGIVNTDVDLFKNFGCLNNHVIELDIGSLKREVKSEESFREEIFRVTDCLHNKLSQDFPSLDAHLLEELAK